MKNFNVLLTCAGGGLSPYLIDKIRKITRHKNLNVIATDYLLNAKGKYFANYLRYKTQKSKFRFLISNIYVIAYINTLKKYIHIC